MSLASDYAATQAAAAANQVSANETQPPSLDGPNATISVTDDGQCRIVPKGSVTTVVIPANQAIAVANWIIATFQ